MGLPLGCLTQADKDFAKKYDLQKVEVNLIDNRVSLLLKSGHYFTLTFVHGDCTACTLWSEFIQTPEDFDNILPIIMDYMSINARINCFFSKKVHEEDINAWLTMLKKHHILGKNVQKSNRDPEQDTYQISGIIKVTNPFIKTYDKVQYLDGNTSYESHNYNDVTIYNQRAAMHKLYQFKE